MGVREEAPPCAVRPCPQCGGRMSATATQCMDCRMRPAKVRNARIFQTFTSGRTSYQDLGLQFGLTAQRVKQIVAKQQRIAAANQSAGQLQGGLPPEQEVR